MKHDVVLADDFMMQLWKAKGTVYYIISYKKWNVYYTLDHGVMKVVRLAHQSQNSV